jgi:hypothetical protein
MPPDEESFRFASKKARGAIALAIVAVLMAASYWIGMGWFESHKKDVCYRQQLSIEEMVTEYQRVNAVGTPPAYLEDIQGYKEPSCPDGGEYVWNPITGIVECTFHGHHGEDYGKKKNKVAGQEVEIIQVETKSGGGGGDDLSGVLG